MKRRVFVCVAGWAGVGSCCCRAGVWSGGVIGSLSCFAGPSLPIIPRTCLSVIIACEPTPNATQDVRSAKSVSARLVYLLRIVLHRELTVGSCVCVCNALSSRSQPGLAGAWAGWSFMFNQNSQSKSTLHKVRTGLFVWRIRPQFLGAGWNLSVAFVRRQDPFGKKEPA
jgi:hypothetical protein